MTDITFGGVTLPEDEDAPTIDITVRGDDESAVETVAMHARAEAVRAMQALSEDRHPEDVDGHPHTVNWEDVVGDPETVTDGGFDPTDPSSTYRCEACGDEVDRDEYAAVGPSTPAAKHLGIDDPSRDHLVVCDDCFERASEEIGNGDAVTDGGFDMGRTYRYRTTIEFDGHFEYTGIAEDEDQAEDHALRELERLVSGIEWAQTDTDVTRVDQDGNPVDDGGSDE